MADLKQLQVRTEGRQRKKKRGYFFTNSFTSLNCVCMVDKYLIYINITVTRCRIILKH